MVAIETSVRLNSSQTKLISLPLVFKHVNSPTLLTRDTPEQNAKNTESKEAKKSYNGQTLMEIKLIQSY